MTPPKRALISLNIDSNAEHLYERIEDHNKEGKDKVKVREYHKPLVGSSSLEILTRPFEKEVQRSVEHIVDGRVVRDTTTSRSDFSGNGKKAKKSVEAKYDTSDL